MYFPMLNSSSFNPKNEVKNEVKNDIKSEVKSEVKSECDKYNELYKGMSIENKYKLMHNMSSQELETFKQCQIKWLKENTNS